MEKKITGSLSLSQIVSLALGVFFVILIVFLMSRNPCVSDQEFSVYKIILSIAIAGLAAVIPGLFKFKYKGIVSATGAIAVFAYVYQFNPAIIKGGGSNCNFDLSLIFYSGENKTDFKENFNATVVVGSGRIENIAVREGRVTINDIPSNLRGGEILLNTNTESYDNTQQRLTIPKEKDFIEVILKKIPDSTLVRGSIIDAENRPLKFARLSINGYESETDENGNYNFKVPVKNGQVSSFRIFKDDKLIYDQSQSVTSDFFNIKVTGQ